MIINLPELSSLHMEHHTQFPHLIARRFLISWSLHSCCSFLFSVPAPGLRPLSWTPNSPRTWERLLFWGAHSLSTATSTLPAKPT